MITSLLIETRLSPHTIGDPRQTIADVTTSHVTNADIVESTYRCPETGLLVPTQTAIEIPVMINQCTARGLLPWPDDPDPPWFKQEPWVLA